MLDDQHARAAPMIKKLLEEMGGAFITEPGLIFLACFRRKVPYLAGLF